MRAGLLRMMSALVLVATSVSCGPTRPTSTPRIALHPCTVDDLRARCGTFVAEGRTSGSVPPIRLRVVVIPSTTGRKPDPVVWFAGGPGDSAVDLISRVRPLFGPHPDRDLVFVDQRGTGASDLTCAAAPQQASPALVRASVRECVRHTSSRPTQYTTARSVDDVSEVLTGLHYASANLVGISYGATAEQYFLLRHPNQVRTMTLLSGTPLSVPVFERFPANAQRALSNIFGECERDHSCRQAFPHLRADWAALWGSITRTPWVVPAPRSPTGHTMRFDALWAAAGLHRQMFSSDTQTRIPLLVHTLGAARDRVAAIVRIARSLRSDAGVGSGRVHLLALTAECVESWARYDPARLDKTSFEYRLDLAAARSRQQVCAALPAWQHIDGATTPHSTVPILAMNGAEDPQDPPTNMAGVRTVWPNSVLLTVPGQGHDIGTREGGCVTEVVRQFLDSPRHFDTRCLRRLPPLQFMTRLPG